MTFFCPLQSLGGQQPAWENRKQGWLAGVRAGIFDRVLFDGEGRAHPGLNFLVPILYVRFGDLDRDWTERNQFCYEEGVRLVQPSEDGTPSPYNPFGLPIFPLSSFKVLGTATQHCSGQIVMEFDPDLSGTLRPFVDTMRGFGIQRYAVWTGTDDLYNRYGCPLGAELFEIADYFEILSTLP